MRLHQYIIAANTSCPNILVLQASQHEYIETTLQVTPVGKKLQTLNTKEDILRIFSMLATPIYLCKMVSNTNVLVSYKG